jgi:transcription initiation factor TFIIH subunit 1
LQQTPESAPKVMLKIFVKSPGSAEAVTHLFHFNSPTNPRGEANAVKDVLANLLSAAKAGDAAIPGSSSAMAMASAVASKPKSGVQAWYDDDQLKADIELQQSLMRKDPALHRTYDEARRTKPDSLTNTQFNSQFWSTRINVLRAHAVETRQQRGTYNVLSTIKPQQQDGQLKLRISKEQIQLIFAQHPLVKRVYDENVPKLDEGEFWSRFFPSRLFKKLKGERIVDVDSTDPTFDRYLNATEEDYRGPTLRTEHIPRVIDIEGNEENQGGAKSGNQKDFTMRPSSSAKAPIIRTLNSLSEKIMAQVAPSDIDPSNPIGMDEATYRELALRDLQGDAEENRIILNIKEQSRFFSSEKSKVSSEATLYAKQEPSEILMDMSADLDPATMDSDAAGGLNLRTAIGVQEDSDSEDEEEPKQSHVGSKSSLIDAQKHILEAIAQHRAEIDGPDTKSSLQGLSQTLFDRLTLTHATTTEFLHHFWVAFLSGDPDRAEELSRMVETLERARARIRAVADDAEEERKTELQKRKEHIRKIYEESGKKLQWNPNAVGGGSAVVMEMLEPTMKALDRATQEFQKAVALGPDASLS